MSLIKVPWYVLGVKNMHFGSPSDSWDSCGKAKQRYVKYILRQGKAELHILELTSMFHHLPSVCPELLCAIGHLGCTREAPTSKYLLNHREVIAKSRSLRSRTGQDGTGQTNGRT